MSNLDERLATKADYAFGAAVFVAGFAILLAIQMCIQYLWLAV